MSFGAGDFLGGIASHQLDSRRVALLAKVVSLLLMPIAALGISGAPTTAGLLAGLAVGVVSPVALSAFYAAMARGPMSVVSPLTAVFVAIVPLVTAIVGGERPSGLVWAGAVVAVPAVVLMSLSGGAASRPSGQALLLAVVAGGGFGAIFALLGTVPDDAGLWPVAYSNVVAVPVLMLMTRDIPVGPATKAAIGAGVLDAAGNGTFVAAAQNGSLVLTALLGSMYPAMSIVLARVVLGERPRQSQLLGMALALVAVLLLGTG
jgi:uncharacterized membrane protein